MSSLFAAFGDVTFSPKLSPSSFEVQQGAVFAEHALVRRAPRIQFVGRELDAITLGIRHTPHAGRRTSLGGAGAAPACCGERGAVGFHGISAFQAASEERLRHGAYQTEPL